MDMEKDRMLGDAIVNFFASFGILGSLIALFIIFLIDSMLFPTLPEFFLLVIYLTNPAIDWGIVLVFVSVVSTFIGNSVLYWIAKKYRYQWIDKIVKKYSSLLISKDEKILLINRAIPILPYTGIFIAINEWDYKKSMFYIVLGGILKFFFLIALCSFFYELFEKGIAQKATFLLVIITLLIGFFLSYYKRRNMESYF